MDRHLRELQHRAIETGSEEDLQAYLAAAYRAGHYRKPKRKEIQKILRRQRKSHNRRGMLYSPRTMPFGDAENMNASGLQHPDEIKNWDGSYTDWNDALKTALPGERFEVSTYSRVGPPQNDDWDLDDIMEMEVPAEIYPHGDYYYGPPPEFTMHRNPQALQRDDSLMERIISRLHRGIIDEEDVLMAAYLGSPEALAIIDEDVWSHPHFDDRDARLISLLLGEHP